MILRSFSKTVKNRQKEFKSFRDAQKNSLDLFNDSKDSKSDNTINKHIQFLLPGRIYTYDYDPVTKDILAFYDKHPLVLAIDHKFTKSGKRLDIGINLNFLPFEAKLAIMDVTFKSYGLYIKGNKILFPKNVDRQRRLPINYEIIKRLLGENAKFAIRTYYTHRRSNTYKLLNKSV